MTNNTSILDKRIIDITPTDFAEMFNNIFDKIVESMYVMFFILITVMMLYYIYKMITNRIGVNAK